VKNKKLLKVLISLVFFLFIYNSNEIFAESPLKNRVLSRRKRALVLYESSSFSAKWAAKNLIDGKRKRGWRSKKKCPFPHIIVFELASNAKIDLLRFNNSTREAKHPGISVKEVQVEFSIVSSDSGYINVGTFALKQGAELQEYKILKTKARWIRLSIKSNYGHPRYTELKEFAAWGVFELKIIQIFSNLIWILGAALILAVFSYHEFLARMQKARSMEVFKRDSFKTPFLLGLILVAVGIGTSIQRLWLAAIIGVVAFFLIIWFVKFIKTQATQKKEDRD
jgi:hypothetical protein